MTLTKTQREIVTLLSQGLTQKQIAECTSRSLHLVAAHIHAARQANGIKTTPELLFWFGKESK